MRQLVAAMDTTQPELGAELVVALVLVLYLADPGLHPTVGSKLICQYGPMQIRRLPHTCEHTQEKWTSQALLPEGGENIVEEGHINVQT